jgi:DNA-binding transcriptional ArsR family regulator
MERRSPMTVNGARSGANKRRPFFETTVSNRDRLKGLSGRQIRLTERCSTCCSPSSGGWSAAELTRNLFQNFHELRIVEVFAERRVGSAAVEELIGEPARAAILIALLDGKSRTAGELGLTAKISAQSARAHLSKLVDGGLLTMHRSNRHRFYSMAGPEIARAREALGSISTLEGKHVRSSGCNGADRASGSAA